MMWMAALLACTDSTPVSAPTHIFVAPVNGSTGIFIEVEVPMRMQLFPPEIDQGLNLVPFIGKTIDTQVQAEVACLDDEVLLDLFVSGDEVTMNLRSGGQGVFGIGTEGATTTRRRGGFDQEIPFQFPCFPGTITHSVEVSWSIDRNAPVPEMGGGVEDRDREES